MSSSESGSVSITRLLSGCPICFCCGKNKRDSVGVVDVGPWPTVAYRNHNVVVTLCESCLEKALEVARDSPPPSPEEQKPQQEERYCGSCAYLKRGYAGAGGMRPPRCHRNPPTVNGQTGESEWPSVEGSDWCGEWEEKQ